MGGPPPERALGQAAVSLRSRTLQIELSPDMTTAEGDRRRGAWGGSRGVGRPPRLGTVAGGSWLPRPALRDRSPPPGRPLAWGSRSSAAEIDRHSWRHRETAVVAELVATIDRIGCILGAGAATSVV
jgi:hypothetical protein